MRQTAASEDFLTAIALQDMKRCVLEWLPLARSISDRLGATLLSIYYVLQFCLDYIHCRLSKTGYEGNYGEKIVYIFLSSSYSILALQGERIPTNGGNM